MKKKEKIAFLLCFFALFSHGDAANDDVARRSVDEVRAFRMRAKVHRLAARDGGRRRVHVLQRCAHVNCDKTNMSNNRSNLERKKKKKKKTHSLISSLIDI
jgi:hypothetical protein